MSVILVQQEPDWLIRLEGQISLACAAELKELLVRWLAAETDLELDLEDAAEVDVSILQLLWTAGREARRANRRIVARPSEALNAAARDAGFEPAAGLPVPD